MNRPAEVIATCKFTDLPAEALAPFSIEAQHPDDFLIYLLDQAPGVVSATVKRQRGNRASAIRPRQQRNSSLRWKAKVSRRLLHGFAGSLTCVETLQPRLGGEGKNLYEAGANGCLDQRRSRFQARNGEALDHRDRPQRGNTLGCTQAVW